MSTRDGESLYQNAGVALLRAAVLSLGDAPERWPAPTDPADCRSWLQTVWDRHEVTEAVRHASPGLAGRVDAIVAGGNHHGERDVRRAALAVARYVLRATGRHTPFGLFAGVAPVAIGSAPRVAWGGDHRAVVRPDAQWLADVIDLLEACPDLLDRLDVVFTNLAVRRGPRLEAPRGSGKATIRRTGAVLAVRDASASPIRFGALVDEVLGAFAGADRVKVEGMLTELVRQGLLITCLRPPLTVADPLGYLIDRLYDVDAPQSLRPLLEELETIRADIEHHNESRTRSAVLVHQRAVLTQRMHEVSAAGRTPLAVDLRLDCDVHLPRDVVGEIERAASALARLTRQPAGPAPWRDYHAAFCERYGTGTVVPLVDVVDRDVGLGFPAGYPGSPAASEPGVSSARDEKLLALAWQAMAGGSREVMLTDETLADLTGSDPSVVGRVARHVEVAARVYAASVESLEHGDYTVAVTPARSAGTLSARFSRLVPDSDLAVVLRSVPPDVSDALTAQLSFPPAYAHAENVCRVPAYLPHVLSLGEHRSCDDKSAVPVEDFAVTATRDGLHLVSLSRRRVIEPQVFHALALEKQAPSLARFLAHLPRARSASWTEFDWGPTSQQLPYLPRVRYGRAVLSPERWRLSVADLPAAEPATKAWTYALDRWRERWRCPELVDLRDADRTLRLSLDEPAHLAILHAHLRRHRTATPTEATPAAALGWLDGHAHDIVVPLVSTQSPLDPVRLDDLPVVTNRHSQLPGSPRATWLAAKVHSHPERHDEIVAEHLPRLLAALDDEPRWWFVRYRSDHETDHLRLRFRIDDHRDWGRHVHTIGQWAEELRHDGLAHRLILDTYAPEIGRYGPDAAAMSAAEHVFAADSHTVAAQLRHIAAGIVDRRALVALGMVDIVQGFLGPDEAMRWLTSRPATVASAVSRSVADQVVDLTRRGGMRCLPRIGGEVDQARRARTSALAAYRRTLPAAADVDAVLEALLHMHHNRALGLDPEQERACRRLARQAALARTAQLKAAAR